MVPTPTPAPPMPIQAIPAPIYLAAIGSMMKLLFQVCSKAMGPSVARVKGIVEVDAGEDGEHVSLQESDQQFERGQRDSKGERYRCADPARETKPAQHGDESSEDFERDVAGQHVGEQTHAVGERTYEEREYFDKHNRRQNVAGDAFGHDRVKKMQAVFPEPINHNSEENEECQRRRDDNVAGHC